MYIDLNHGNLEHITITSGRETSSMTPQQPLQKRKVLILEG